MDFSSPGQTVLCYSHDMVLMLTRQLLLERSGYRVLSAMGPAEFRQRLCQQKVDLIILCQTLPAEDCDAAIQFANEHTPSARCLLFFYTRPKCTLDREYALVDSAAGPREFLTTVSRMLPPQIPPGSRSSPAQSATA